MYVYVCAYLVETVTVCNHVSYYVCVCACIWVCSYAGMYMCIVGTYVHVCVLILV